MSSDKLATLHGSSFGWVATCVVLQQPIACKHNHRLGIVHVWSLPFVIECNSSSKLYTSGYLNTSLKES